MLDQSCALQIGDLGEFGFDIARGQNRAGHAFGAQFVVDRLTKGIYKSLGGEIDGLVRARCKACSRPNVQDLAATLGNHISGKAVGEFNQCLDVEIDHGEFFGQGAVDMFAMPAKACVVDQVVNAKACLRHILIELFCPTFGSKIGHDDMCRDAVLCLQLCLEVGQRGFAARDKDHVAAFGGVIARDFKADARRCAGDKSGF